MKPKPPKKKGPIRRHNPEDISGTRPGERQPPAASERTDNEVSPTRDGQFVDRQKENEQAQPVTNQDEQEKITNAGSDDEPLAEK